MTDTLWLGDSCDVNHGVGLHGLKAVLNVADDLAISRTIPDVAYAQIGLVDGPGNPLAAYHAAVLALYTLLRIGPTMVVDHGGTTSAAVVAIMYQHLTRRMGWDHWLKVISDRYKAGFDRSIIDHTTGAVRTFVVQSDVEINAAHLSAFNRINWRLLCTVMEGV